MLLSHSSLEAIHKFCTANRPLLEQSSSAGCFFCGAAFEPSEISRWLPEYDEATGAPSGETASCPRCGKDSVLPSAAPVAMSPHLLAAMQGYWFGSAKKPRAD
jgi:hypothetical protein